MIAIQRRLLALCPLILLSASAFASVPTPVTITADVVQARQSFALELTVTANLETVRNVSLAVTSTGDMVKPTIESESLVLTAGVPMEVSIPLERRGDATVGCVLVRLSQGDEPVAVKTIYLARGGRRLRFRRWITPRRSGGSSNAAARRMPRGVRPNASPSPSHAA